MGLDTRVVALEEFRIAVTKDISDIKLNNQQQVQTAVQGLQKEAVDQHRYYDSRAIGIWLPLLLLGLNIVWSVVSHFILH
jgi:hypothetical protein